jgi:hypothetical protein
MVKATMPTFQAPIAIGFQICQAQLCRLDVMSEIVSDFEAALAHYGDDALSRD